MRILATLLFFVLLSTLGAGAAWRTVIYDSDTGQVVVPDTFWEDNSGAIIDALGDISGDPTRISTNNGVGWNLTLRPNSINTAALLITNYGWFKLHATNALAATGAFTDYGAFVIGTNQTFGGHGGEMLVPNNFQLKDAVGNMLWFLPSHNFNGTLRPVFYIQGGNDIVFSPGFNSGIQVGSSGNHKNQEINIQYNSTNNSHLMLFSVARTAGSSDRAAIIGRRPVGPYLQDWVELAFFSRQPIWRTSPDPTFSDEGNLSFEVQTNGVRVNGRLATSRELTVSSTIVVDFSGHNQLMASPNSAATISFSGQRNWLTNVDHKTLVIKSGGQSLGLTWPSNVNVMDYPGTAQLPTTLDQAKVLHVRFESVGLGATNVYAWPTISTDRTFYWDPDAHAFFDAASIATGAISNAVNNLVIALKEQGLWTKIDAVYPFVGGNATAHSKNLKNPATFQITWTGTVTHDANGITGDGSTGYGDTGWRPSTDAAQNSAHGAVYNRTQTPTDGRYFFGSVNSAGTGRFTMFKNSIIQFQVNDSATCQSFQTDMRGFLGQTRTVSTSMINQYRSTQITCNTTSVAAADDTLTLLARNWTGFSPDGLGNANLAFACFGDGLTAAELNALRVIVEFFETALGRNVP